MYWPGIAQAEETRLTTASIRLILGILRFPRMIFFSIPFKAFTMFPIILSIMLSLLFNTLLIIFSLILFDSFRILLTILVPILDNSLMIFTVTLFNFFAILVVVFKLLFSLLFKIIPITLFLILLNSLQFLR